MIEDVGELASQCPIPQIQKPQGFILASPQIDEIRLSIPAFAATSPELQHFVNGFKV
jgi:hypothetical protein